MKKRILKIIVIAGAIVLFMVGGLLIFFTVSEYKPDEIEKLPVANGSKSGVAVGQDITIVTCNIGYGALSQNEDFFMDGGEKVRPDDEDLIYANLEGISDVLEEMSADFYLLQEVDCGSKRSYNIDQREYLERALAMPGMFAYNFNSRYVPYPLPTIGKVESGLLTLSDYTASEAARIALPVPFSWPVSTCNLKRCLMITRIPVEGSERELVLINLHLEAYDDGEGKTEQTRMLVEFIESEYEKGNYVVAGGDFNQTFERTLDIYPIHNTDGWTPGVLDSKELPAGFGFAYDTAAPTCRLLNAPYTGNYVESQVYVIDGYIVSPNVEVTAVEVEDMQFLYTDHQPVKLAVRLKSDQ